MEQHGKELMGTLTDEGGSLPVSGSIQDKNITLSGKHIVTVTLAATIDDKGEMSGTFDVLSIHRRWTAKRAEAAEQPRPSPH